MENLSDVLVEQKIETLALKNLGKLPASETKSIFSKQLSLNRSVFYTKIFSYVFAALVLIPNVFFGRKRISLGTYHTLRTTMIVCFIAFLSILLVFIVIMIKKVMSIKRSLKELAQHYDIPKNILKEELGALLINLQSKEKE